MKKRLPAVIMLLAFAVYASLLFLQVPNLRAQGERSHVAVILILDNSGSMKVNDPDGLRFTGAKLFVSLLDSGDAAGIIRFSTESQALTNGLVAIHGVREKKEVLSRLSPSAPEGWTDAKAAFEDARRMLSNINRVEYQPVVVFLTDGKPEIPKPYAGYEQDALKAARSLNLPVMAIALTREAESPFLSQVAQTTGGEVLPARGATDLLDAYLSILGQLKDRTIVGKGVTQAPGKSVLVIDKALSPYVTKASFIVSKPGTVQAILHYPNGKTVHSLDPDVTFALTEDKRFAIYTVKNPVGGDWYFELHGQGQVQARAILHSRLRVRIVQPGSFHELGVPMRIVAHIVEEKENGNVVRIIGDASFNARIHRPNGSEDSLDRFFDNGTHGDRLAGDGDFSRSYVDTGIPGMYEIAVQGFKGVVPVRQTTRVFVVPFPQIAIDEPAQQVYEVRRGTIPIRVHLEGGTPPQLDKGQIVAKIVTPSGEVKEKTLTQDGNSYSREFLPLEDGKYSIEIAARDAYYKGLPYTHSAHNEITVRIIPTITVQTSSIDLGSVELLKGHPISIPVSLTVSSTSRYTETAQIQLKDMAGFTLETGKTLVPPGKVVVLKMKIVPSQGVTEGTHEGKLVVRSREGVDIKGSPVPVRVYVVWPRVYLLSPKIDIGQLSGCRRLKGEKVKIRIRNHSILAAQLHLETAGGNVSVSPTEISVPPGEITATLQISLPSSLPSGKYSAHIRATTRRGVPVIPPQLTVVYVVPSIVRRCELPILGGGVLILLLLLIAIKIVKGIIAASRPPEVRGTLRYWKEGQRRQYVDKDLSAFGKQEISVGSGPNNDIVISGLDSTHLRLAAEKEDDQVRVYLEPVGEIRTGLRKIERRTLLKHSYKFSVGPYEFQYLSENL